MNKKIPIGEIEFDKELQSRDLGTCETHIEDLIEAYGDPDVDLIPLPVVWKVPSRPGKYYLTQGCHRVIAQQRMGRDTVECDVKHGDWANAVLDAAASNVGHGLKRSRADKRRCVEMVLAVNPDWGDREVARRAGVHHQLVGQIRAELDSKAEITQPTNVDDHPPANSQTDAKSQPSQRQLSSADIYTKDDAEIPPVKGAYNPRFIQTSEGEKCIDAHDNPVPDGLGDTFADPSLRQLFLAAEAATKAVDDVVKGIVKTLKKGSKWPYIDLPTVDKIAAKFREAAVDLQEHLREAFPHIVCPACQGRTCKACKDSGYIAKGVYDTHPEFQARKRG
jgi:hypothetical protein